MVPWVALTAASAARGQADKPTTDVAALRIHSTERRTRLLVQPVLDASTCRVTPAAGHA